MLGKLTAIMMMIIFLWMKSGPRNLEIVFQVPVCTNLVDVIAVDLGNVKFALKILTS